MLGHRDGGVLAVQAYGISGSWHPIGELEYLEGIERHDNDPEHQPFPPPPLIRRAK